MRRACDGRDRLQRSEQSRLIRLLSEIESVLAACIDQLFLHGDHVRTEWSSDVRVSTPLRTSAFH